MPNIELYKNHSETFFQKFLQVLWISKLILKAWLWLNILQENIHSFFLKESWIPSLIFDKIYK